MRNTYGFIELEPVQIEPVPELSYAGIEEYIASVERCVAEIRAEQDRLVFEYSSPEPTLRVIRGGKSDQQAQSRSNIIQLPCLTAKSTQGGDQRQ